MNPNPEYAQIETVFELISENIQFSAFLENNKDSVTTFLFLSTMDGNAFEHLGGEFIEIGVDEGDLWDWKTEQEKYGNIVFWIKDKHKEIYALSLPRKGAKLFYGLWKISKWDGIKSSWK